MDLFPPCTSRRITGQRTSLHGHCSRHTVQYTNRRIAGQRSSLHGLGSRHIGTSLRVSSQCSSLHGPCSHNILVVALLISILVYMGIVPGIQYTSRRIAGRVSQFRFKKSLASVSRIHKKSFASFRFVSFASFR